MRILALDVGTSAVKAGVYTGTRQLSQARVDLTTRFAGDRAEIPTPEILAAIRLAAKNALAGAKVDAIAFCAFSSGLVVTDRAGRPRTNVITHADRRSAEVARRIVKQRGKSWWLARTGNLPYPGGIGASALAWLSRHESAVMRNNARVGQISSLIGFMLTGKWITDPSQAVFLGLWDIRRRAWNPEICKLVGVPLQALPDVQPADTVAGGLETHIARAWNLPSGIPVIGGFIDTSAAIIQSSMLSGQLIHNSGSTDVLAMCLNDPVPQEGILTRPIGTGTVFPERWLAVRTIASAGSAIAWARETFFRDMPEKKWRISLRRAAITSTDISCNPAFAGERASLDHGAGAIIAGLRLGTTREHILAAIIAGLARQSAHAYQLLTSIHHPRKTVVAMGGASLLQQAMHRAWPARHRFDRGDRDGLRGLALLASAVVNT